MLVELSGARIALMHYKMDSLKPTLLESLLIVIRTSFPKHHALGYPDEAQFETRRYHLLRHLLSGW